MESILSLILRLKKQGTGGQEAKKELADLKGQVDTLKGAAQLLAGSAALGAVVAGLKFCVDEARAARQAMAQTEAAIKATGGAAGLSANQVSDIAGELERMTLASAETIQEGQNMLLTFKEIKGQTFERATASMLDLAVAMNKGSLEGLDMQSTSIQIGKALNDPIRGVTALTKVGVTFNEQQRTMIRTLQESGDMAGAQAIILAELESEFGGSAKAAGEAAGAFKKVEVIVGNLAEAFGTRLLPVLEGAAQGGINLAKTIGALYLIDAKFLGVLDDQEIATRAAALASDDFATAIFGVEKETSKTADTLAGRLTPALERSTGAFGHASDAMSKALTPAEQLKQSTSDLATIIGGELGKETEAYADKQADLSTRMAEAQAKLDEYLAKNGQAITITQDAKISQEKYQLQLQKVAEAHQKLEDAQAAGAEDTLALTVALQDAEAKAGAMAGQLGGVTTATSDYNKQIAEQRGIMQDLKGEYAANAAAHQEATARIVFGFVQQRMAADGLQEGEIAALGEIGRAWGIYDQATADALAAVDDALTKHGDNAAGILHDLQGNINGLHGVDIPINIVVNGGVPTNVGSVPTGIGSSSGGNYGGVPVPGQYGPGAAGGADFVVPPGYPHDSYPLRVESGERVQITPAGAAAAGRTGGGDLHLTVNVTAAGDSTSLQAQIRQAVREANDELDRLMRSFLLSGAGA